MCINYQRLSMIRRPGLVHRFFFSSRRRHTRSVSAFLLNRSSDLHSFPTRRTLFHVLVGCGLLMLKVSRLRSEERRVGKEWTSRWAASQWQGRRFSLGGASRYYVATRCLVVADGAGGDRLRASCCG